MCIIIHFILIFLSLNEIKPQEGFQNDFLSTPADIAVGGGAAGAGKTFALLMEPLRHIKNKDFGSVTFRRTTTQIRSEGGLWDTSKKLYSIVGAQPKETRLEWDFNSGAKAKFTHLEYEKTVLDWQGSQIPLICFDELTHFTSYMFFYMLSRNRSTCGVSPYVRATCNPDPDSWLADFLKWWINQDTGFPEEDRAGKLRYFIKDENKIIWGDSKSEVKERAPHIIDAIKQAEPTVNENDLIKSVTFIPGTIYGNKELLKVDPGYLSNLMAQDKEIKAQLLEGNWKVKIDGTDLINPFKLEKVFTSPNINNPTDRYITADIALRGSDLMVVYVWEGFEMIDFEVMEIAKGNEVIGVIRRLAQEHSVDNNHIIYDSDGVGQFIDGFIQNSVPFVNNGTPVNGEQYKNLKTQMFYKLAKRINDEGYYIPDHLTVRKIKGKSLKEHLKSERRAIKRDKIDMDGKLCIIPKNQMIEIIGHSTDFMDSWMMREYFECGLIGNDWMSIM